MKKSILLLFLCALLPLLASCGKSAGEESTLEAVLTDMGMSVMHFVDDNGVQYDFLREDINPDNGSLPEIGDKVLLSYQGKLGEDGGTDGVKEIHVKEVLTKRLKGAVTNGSMNTLSVKPEEDGEPVTLYKGDAIVDAPDGILLGETVDVAYTEETGKDSQKALNAVYIRELSSSVEGTVTAADEDSIVLETDAYGTLSFDRTTARLDEQNPGVGDRVKIIYDGSLTEDTPSDASDAVLRCIVSADGQ